jgi:hypothetical protein
MFAARPASAISPGSQLVLLKTRPRVRMVVRDSRLRRAFGPPE